jgi:hypothetical protein
MIFNNKKIDLSRVKPPFFRPLKLPYVNARTVDEYFSLPRSQREWCGLYKLPYALPSERLGDDPGWESFYKKIKKMYPVQYFFRYWLPSYDNPVVYFYYKWIVWPLSSFKQKLRWLFNPWFPRWRKVAFNPSRIDVSELVIESNFALICDFYWEEVVDGVVDWTDTKEHKQFYDELVSAVNWIEKERDIVEEQLRQAYKKSSSMRIKTKSGHFDYYATYEEPIKLEKYKEAKEEEILKWFIVNRGYFWT